MSENRDREVERILKEDNYYRVLDVNIQDCENDKQKVRNNFEKFKARVHPDRCNHSRAKEAFEKLRHAYYVLSDDEKREHYNQHGDTWQSQKQRQEAKQETRQDDARRFNANAGRQRRAQQGMQPEVGFGGRMCMTLLFLIMFSMMANGGSGLWNILSLFSRPVTRDKLKGIIQFDEARNCMARTSSKYKAKYFIPSWWLSNVAARHAERGWGRIYSKLDTVADVLYEEDLEIKCELEKNRLGKEGTQCANMKRILGR